MTPDDATATVPDAPEITFPSPDRVPPAGGPIPGTAPISETDPDENPRDPHSPRSDVSGAPLDLVDGLPAGAPRVATASLRSQEATRRLRAIGFRIRSTGELDQAVRAFKTGWFELGPALLDGTVASSIIGPRASRAIDLAFERGQDGLTTMSPHFSFLETRCRCGGHFTDCRRIWPTRGSVIAAEELRKAFYPDGLKPVSWCRCTGHNTAIGGATSSRHLRGDAVDIPPTNPAQQIRGLERYTGIGVHRSEGTVRHLDLRPGSPAAPVLWYCS